MNDLQQAYWRFTLFVFGAPQHCHAGAKGFLAVVEFFDPSVRQMGVISPRRCIHVLFRVVEALPCVSGLFNSSIGIRGGDYDRPS